MNVLRQPDIVQKGTFQTKGLSSLIKVFYIKRKHYMYSVPSEYGRKAQSERNKCKDQYIVLIACSYQINVWSPHNWARRRLKWDKGITQWEKKENQRWTFLSKNAARTHTHTHDEKGCMRLSLLKQNGHLSAPRWVCALIGKAHGTKKKTVS